jgi:hypothetical protein
MPRRPRLSLALALLAPQGGVLEMPFVARQRFLLGAPPLTSQQFRPPAKMLERKPRRFNVACRDPELSDPLFFDAPR